MSGRARAADVIVVGGGLVGCAVARELSRRGLRIELVERGELGTEASRAAAGMVAPQAECDGDGPVLRLGLASRAMYPAWVAALEGESELDVEFRTDGILAVALTEADARILRRRARWQRAAGLRVDDLPSTAARRLAPVVARSLRAAVHFPDDHRVNNERLVVAAGIAARRAGVTVRERAPVQAVLARDGRVVGVRTDDGVITAPVVVNAAGAWAGAIALPDGVAPPPVVPVRGQMLVLRGAPGVLPLPLYGRDVYLVPRLDGRILAGSTREHVGFEKRVTLAAAADLLAAAHAVAPGLGGLTFEHGYAGLRPGTPDDLPLVGPAPELPGLVYAAGLFRHGILLAPAVAQAVADLIVDGRTALPLAGMRPGRFRRSRA
ncbi:MAG TPA: glycine oxidase ThiO [Candidatus Binatia bacterium]|jgi:glycine oxidase|nr:glycine oxidase ThiO [Candidatus Binatia bacterium]